MKSMTSPKVFKEAEYEYPTQIDFSAVLEEIIIIISRYR
jgi:hypothetical protein